MPRSVRTQPGRRASRPLLYRSGGLDMSEESRRTATVSLAVYPATKDEWEKTADADPNADSLSQLIRVAVNRYRHEQSDASGAGTQDLQEQLTELNTQYERLAHTLDEVKGHLGEIRESVKGPTVRPEVEDLADEVFNLLPTKQEAHTESVLADQDDGVPAPLPGSVEWLSDRLDAPQYQIQTALNHLQNTTYSVQQTDDGRYFTEV